MKRYSILIITLTAILFWINSCQAQTLTETVPPSGPTVVVIFTSSNGGDPVLTTIATLSGLPPTSSKKSTTGIAATTASGNKSSTLATNNSDDSDPSTHHIPSPVAMIAGSLAGFIAILAAILVVCVTRKRHNGKRRRRRASIIRALEAQHAHSGENLDRDGYAISESGSMSEEHSTSRRPPSTRNSTRESARSGKKKSSTRSSGKHTAHVHVSPSGDVELNRRDTGGGRSLTHAQEERPRITSTSSPATSSNLTNTTSTAAATVGTSPSLSLDSKQKFVSNDVSAHGHRPHWNTQSPDHLRRHSSNAYTPPSPALGLNSPHQLTRPSLSLPTVNKSEADLPPAYEDIR
ncbi:hypothetical protein JR316_0000091 [Psilocybe cubensis]|uniref:Uncharacterized protein n=2 Tax=Psilocybe cubensis TaxID=181762 RepID=A0ACB8HEF4_PSICU|nr:hypothetical protein JR316_0000091 [Psilocybe cubensis]KAH9486027.1 hypothetical protein JR316_0000091 [Psilocybe cubensis]